MNVLSILVSSHDLHNLNEMSSNGLYDLYVNGLNSLSIKVCPRDVHGLQNLFFGGLNELLIHICPHYVGDSGDVMS